MRLESIKEMRPAVSKERIVKLMGKTRKADKYLMKLYRREQRTKKEKKNNISHLKSDK